MQTKAIGSGREPHPRAPSSDTKEQDMQLA